MLYSEFYQFKVSFNIKPQLRKIELVSTACVRQVVLLPVSAETKHNLPLCL